jgi:hypothetical protein
MDEAKNRVMLFECRNDATENCQVNESVKESLGEKVCAVWKMCRLPRVGIAEEELCELERVSF